MKPARRRQETQQSASQTSLLRHEQLNSAHLQTMPDGHRQKTPAWHQQQEQSLTAECPRKALDGTRQSPEPMAQKSPRRCQFRALQADEPAKRTFPCGPPGRSAERRTLLHRWFPRAMQMPLFHDDLKHQPCSPPPFQQAWNAGWESGKDLVKGRREQRTNSSLKLRLHLQLGCC